MKIYKNKDGRIIIVFGKTDENTGVTLVHDRGAKPVTNMFGGKVSRYVFHCADAYGDSGYATSTDSSLIDKDFTEYKIVKKNKK